MGTGHLLKARLVFASPIQFAWGLSPWPSLKWVSFSRAQHLEKCKSWNLCYMSFSFLVANTLFERDENRTNLFNPNGPTPFFFEKDIPQHGHPLQGVLGSHTATLNRLTWQWRRFPWRSGDVVCLRTPLVFVDHVAEVFAALLASKPTLLCPPTTTGPGLLTLGSDKKLRHISQR